jgi:hypothetical protein
MQIAYTSASERGATDLLLAHVAGALMSEGLRVCGTVQINSNCERDGPCDMDVQVLPDGPVLRISQSLGPGARGCRLDPAALETAVGHTARTLSDGADLLIINKFGKHEASGRGFRPVIGEALSLGVPVLVGLNALNAPAFHAFCGEAATALPPERHAILDWVERVCAAPKAGAAQ